jgi:hypothetical protein
VPSIQLSVSGTIQHSAASPPDIGLARDDITASVPVGNIPKVSLLLLLTRPDRASLETRKCHIASPVSRSLRLWM